MLLAYNLGGKVYLAESEDPQKGFVGSQIGIAGEVSSLFADGEDIYLLYTQDKDLYGALLTKDGGTYSVGEKVKLVGASSVRCTETEINIIFSIPWRATRAREWNTLLRKRRSVLIRANVF